eukprot:751572-Hanusia_phi.AAC.4
MRAASGMESDGEPGWRAYVDEKDPVVREGAACRGWRAEAVCELLEGAGREWLEGQQGTNFDINTPSQAKGNREGWTPLFYAATSGDEQVVEYLLTKRADVNARDAIGNRSLTYAHGPYVRKILRSLMTREESKAEAWKLHGIACEKIKEHLQSLEEVSNGLITEVLLTCPMKVSRLHELKASNLLTSSYVAYKISERKKASAPTGEAEKQEPIFEDVEDKWLQSKISGCNQRIESLSSEVLQKFRQSFVALLQAWELHGNIGQSWNKVQRQLSVYNGIPPDVETMNRCQSCLDKAQIGKDQEKLTLTELESLSRIVSGVLPMKEALMNFLQRHSKDGRYAILLTDFAFAFEDFETICEIFNLQDRIDSCLKTHFEALNAYHEDTLDEHNFDLAERAQMMTEHALRTSNEEFQTKIAQQFGFSSLTNFLNATKTSISTKRMRVNHLFAFIKKMEVSGILLERIDFLRSSQFTRLQAQVTITELEDLLRTAKQDLKTCSEPAHANSALLLLLSSIVLSKRAADTSGMQQQRRKIEVPDEILEVLMRDRDDLLHHILFRSFPKLFDGPSTQNLVSQENLSRDQFVMRYKSFIREFWLQSANSKLKQTVQQCAERRRRLASYLTALGALAEAEDRFADADYAYSKRRSKEAKELFLKSETKEYNLLCRCQRSACKIR